MVRRVLVVLVVLAFAAELFAAQHTVTKVAIVAKPRSFSGPCPATLQFTATIFVSHPSKVTYVWERSDGAKGPRQTIDIRSAGQGVTDTWTLGAGRQHMVVWERLHVLAPTGISSPQGRVSVTCR